MSFQHNHLSRRQFLATLLGAALCSGCAEEASPIPVLPAPTVTPLPAPPAYATRTPRREQGGSSQQTTLLLPGQIYQLDLAVHPLDGWPVVGAMQRWSLSTDPAMVLVRVYNPNTGRWGVAQQVDIGASSVGRDRFASIVVGVTGDNTVHAAWGSSDSDGGIWASSSTDYGVRWTEPQRIAPNCWGVNGMATSADGQVVVLASGYVGPHAALVSRAKLIVRRPDGTWLPAETLNAPGWFGTVVIVGDGADARAIALTTSHAAPADVAYLCTKRLADTSPWLVQTCPITVPGAYHLHQRGLVFARPQADGSVEPGVAFGWHGQYRASAYAFVSLDGGQSWGTVETIVGRDGRDDSHLLYTVPAYDPGTDRLFAIWTDGDPTTHYASWSTPGSGVWSPLARAGAPLPLAFGARDASITVAAQTANSRQAWLAWVERDKQIEVRSVDLDTLVPTTPGGTR